MNKEYIKVENIKFRYGDRQVLTDVSFSIQQGEIISLIGPNGSGKTTLVKIIIGLFEPAGGRVLIEGKSPKAMKEQIAYVPQKFDFDKDIPLSVHEFMSFDDCGKSKHGCAYIETRLKEVGMPNSAHKKIGELSGGQFQRVMIARALLHEKSILAFDEPLAGIDMAGGASNL